MAEFKYRERSSWLPLAVAVLWALFLWYGFFRHRTVQMYDFLPTYAAGKIIGDADLAAELYRVDETRFNTLTSGPLFDVSLQVDPLYSPTPFVYPPLYAWLVRPLSGVSYDVAKMVLLLASAVSFVTGVLALWLSTGREPDLMPMLAGVALFGLWFSPINYSNWLGQITILVFGLVCVSLLCAVRGREWCSGALLGLALSVKLFPLGVLVLLAARRKFRAVLGAIAAWLVVILGSALLSGFPLVASYIATIRSIGDAGSLAVWNNQSLIAFFLRFSATWDAILRWHFLDVSTWIWLVVYAVVLGFLVWSLRILGHSGGTGLVYAQGVMLSLIMTPVVWNHYEVLAIVPLFWIANRLYTSRTDLDPRRWVAALAGAWILMALDTSWIAYEIADGRVREEVAGLPALPVSANLFGVVLLFALLNILAAMTISDREFRDAAPRTG